MRGAAGRPHHRLHSGSPDDPGSWRPEPGSFNVVLGQAREVRSTPSGDAGTVFSGQGIEMVWVSKLAEPIDQNWFSSDRVDLILVFQGQLKFEFGARLLSERPLFRMFRG